MHNIYSKDLVGVCSYLLVSFWFTRMYANISSVSAFLTNRVGDCFLTIGMFAVLSTLGNLDYATVFSLAPYINSDLVTIIGICFMIGAMAKSAQLGLHVWLPLAMEGKYFNYYFIYLCDLLVYIIKSVSSKIPARAVYNIGVSPISNRSTTCSSLAIDSSKYKGRLGLRVWSVQLLGSKQFVYSLVTSSKGKSSCPIWVYDITKLSINNGLVPTAPFKTKSACAKAINITRGYSYTLFR